MSLRSPLLYLGLLLGLAAGLLYGWVLRPAQTVDTSPASLRQDYRTDYVLMVAEIYAGDRDAPRASARLAALGSPSPAAHVEAAMEYATDQGFSTQDIERLSLLARGLQDLATGAEASSP
jgi:hypothetical protein